MPLSDITSLVPESTEIPEDESHRIVFIELIARNHHKRALEFLRLITAPESAASTLAGVGTFTYGQLFLARACYTRLLIDLEWTPTQQQAVTVIQSLDYLEDYTRCSTCGLPTGIWCNDRLNGV